MRISILIGIVLLGFFLRSYHFSDWLHFELDQARDARIVDDGLRGDFFDLPLLGPKAGGTTLRLPPAFYYLEYGSAVLFGGSPAGMATGVMLFSVAAIVVFYLLMRRYFSVSLSLGLTLLFSVSEFFVMYGRFAWNPNLIPFFLLFGWYTLLRSLDEDEWYPERFFLVAVGSLSLAMQFHFLAFVSIPIITVALLVLRRPSFSWKVWLGSFGIVLFLFFPMFLNELETGFANSKAFFQAVTEKSSKKDYSLAEKGIKEFSEHALFGLVITTGFEGGTFPKIVLGTEEGEVIGWACDERCDRGKWYGLAAVIVLGLSLVALLWQSTRQTIRRKKDFLLLVTLWFSVTFLLFTPLAYDMVPRFFLISGPIFFILIGLFLVTIKSLPRGRVVTGSIVALTLGLLVWSNIASLSERFRELSLASMTAIDSPPDRILKERIRVTFEQQERIVDFLEYRSQETGYPVYMWSEPQHRRALKYLMEQRGIQNAVLGFDGIYEHGVYYMILRAQSDIDDALKKHREKYEIGSTTSFGTLVAIELVPKEGIASGIRQEFSIIKPNDSQGLPRYTWREFFSQRGASGEEDEEEVVDDEAL